ncbi:MAG: PRC-barrel domain-containing protein [Caulobacteraceae bacterium]|nr:PRC-barrel domain-containing protein [Caulobacteraceae bacterium]
MSFARLIISWNDIISGLEDMKMEMDWSAPDGRSGLGFMKPKRTWVRAPGQSWYRPAEASPSMREPRPHRRVTASRVKGAAVFGPGGRRIGRVRDVIIDDATGQVAFVLIACGGILGFGERLRRASWSALTYEAERIGYVLDEAGGDTPSPVPLSKAAVRDDRGAEAGG